MFRVFQKIKILFFLGLILSIKANADYWTQMSTFPGLGKSHPFNFSIGSRGYVGCGDPGDNDVWEYDAVSNSWTQKADFGWWVCWGGVGFTINGKGYVATGSLTNYMWEYNPQNDSWTQKTNFPGGGQEYSQGFAIGDNGYVGGGDFLNDYFYAYNQPTNTWTMKMNMPEGLQQSEGFSIGGKGYFCTGYGPWNLNFLWEYDPIINQWSQKANFPGAPRVDAAAFVICDKGYICVGGEAPYYADTWQYDPQTNQWLQKAFFPGNARDDAAFFAIGNKGYVGLGQYSNNTYYYDFWEYTPDSVCDLLPVALFYGPPNGTCPGTCVPFSNFSIASTSNNWSFPGSNTPTSTDVNPTNICYPNPGNYDVILIATNAFGSDTLIMPNYISVYPTPAPQSITQSHDTLFAISGAFSYQWYLNHNLINGATNYFYVANSSGDYNVVASDTNGCEVEAALFNVIASISSEELPSDILIYPKLFNDHISVKASEYILRIQLFNSRGNEISVKSNLGTFATDQISSGIYFLKIETTKGWHVEKVIKE